MKSELKADFSDNKRVRGRQLDISDDPVGNRIIQALAGRPRKWLADASGLSPSTISDCIKSGISKTEPAVAIANALGCSVDWLLTGSKRIRSAAVASVEDADWVEVPEISLSGIDDARKGEEVSRATFRRDWLHQSYGRSNGLWTTRLPSDYPPLDLVEGDLVICCDAVREELHERQLCIWRSPILGRLLVARFTFVHRGNSLVAVEDGDYWVNPYLLPNEMVEGGGGDLLPVGRILGRPFSRIR
jgi:hypothetical protein